MSKYFNNIEEVKNFFADYDLSNWLTNNFEIIVKENGINKITFTLKSNIITIRDLDNFGYSHYLGTYEVEDTNMLINIIKQLVYDDVMQSS